MDNKKLEREIEKIIDTMANQLLAGNNLDANNRHSLIQSQAQIAKQRIKDLIAKTVFSS
jgi:hypothetical protein